MVLYEESQLRPEPYNFIHTQLDVYVTDEENFEPYVSPYNTLSGASLNEEEETEENTGENSEEETSGEEEEETLDDEGEDSGYTLHQGEILETHEYKTLYSVEWGKDYSEWSGEATVKLPYHKKDLEYLYKGVRCLLKVNRYPMGTDVDELARIDKEEYDKILAEVKQERKAREEENKNKEKQTPSSTDSDTDTESDEPEPANRVEDEILPEYDFLVQHSFLCFITDVKFSMEGTELKLTAYEKLLEQEDQLAFTQMLRSDIIKEVIKTAGLHAKVDSTGLLDEVIDWTSVSASSEDDDDGGATGEALFGEDCTDTNSMACKHGGGYGNTGTGENFDECAKKGYAVKDTNYYKWARKFKNIKDMLSALRKIWSYSYYYNNKTCPQQLFNESGFSCNCYDAARMVKVLCDSAGFPCVVVTGSIWQGGHGWNAVKVDGGWKSFDMCYGSHMGEKGGTNESNIR